MRSLVAELYCFEFSSVFRRCWLGDRNGIRPVETHGTYHEFPLSEQLEKIDGGLAIGQPCSPGNDGGGTTLQIYRNPPVNLSSEHRIYFTFIALSVLGSLSSTL